MTSSVGVREGDSPAITTPLLKEPQATKRVVLKRQVPLTEREADLYMQTKEYDDNLDKRLASMFCYIDLNGKVQATPLKVRATGLIYKPTEDQSERFIDKFAEAQKRQDKITLKTKGIGFFPEPIFKKEISKAHLIATSIIWCPCICPCSIILWHKLYKERGIPRLKDAKGKNYKGFVYVSEQQLRVANICSN